MHILAIDELKSSTMLKFLSVDTCSTDVKVATTIECRLSQIPLSYLHEGDLHIRLRNGIMKQVPKRRHKKRRIQKKWIKRYGMTDAIEYNEVLYRVDNMEVNVEEDYVIFYCYSIRCRTYTKY